MGSVMVVRFRITINKNWYKLGPLDSTALERRHDATYLDIPE